MKKLFLTSFIILAGIIEITAQNFTVGNLRYSINEDGSSVTLTGHVHSISGELNIPESVTYEENDYPVTAIGKEAFMYCSGLTGSLIIPQSVSYIGEGAFMYCTGFDGNLILPDSIAEIERYAFGGCSGLTGPLNIPITLTRINNQVFAYCGFTGPLIIPDSVTYIGDGAFVECRGFSGDLVIGKSVKCIGLYAFGYCSGITNVVSLSTEPAEAYYNEFEYLDCTTLSVPCGFIQAYYYAGWLRHFTTVNENCSYLTHPEWYYELMNDSGEITYQYLSCQGDTTIQHKKVKIIVKTNTLYDKESIEQTEEYIYVDNNNVYWWNKTIEEFTVLYDFGAQVGDYWEIKAGLNSIVVHVDMVGQAEYDGIVYKTLQISDYDDIFSGTIVCTVGHLTSFFPEKMLENKGNYEVDGLRCHWNNGELLFKVGDTDCDYVYDNHHFDVDEIAENGFEVYPNPSHENIFVQSDKIEEKYRILNLLGESILTGIISSENQQIDISSLSEGIYFITIGNATMKFMKM